MSGLRVQLECMRREAAINACRGFLNPSLLVGFNLETPLTTRLLGLWEPLREMHLWWGNQTKGLPSGGGHRGTRGLPSGGVTSLVFFFVYVENEECFAWSELRGHFLPRGGRGGRQIVNPNEKPRQIEKNSKEGKLVRHRGKIQS